MRPELSRFFFTVQPTQLHGIDGLTHPSTIERLEADTVLLKARIVGERGADPARGRQPAVDAKEASLCVSEGGGIQRSHQSEDLPGIGQ